MIGRDRIKIIINSKKVLIYISYKSILNWMPDELYIKLIYYVKMDKKLNINNPQTFNEKLQWLKLYDRRLEYTGLVDKYEVRKYIKNTIGERYLIPLIGVWNKFDDIDFSKLPNQFVLKCTHDSGSVFICNDKSKFDKKAVKKKIQKSLKRNFYYPGREWPYKNIKPRIICEKYIVDESGTELKDYKLFCFNGKPKFIQVISGRENGKYYINHYDLNWNLINIKRKEHVTNLKEIKRPQCLEEMINISEKLSQNMPFVRIDLYNIKSQILFGEITFFPASGYMGFENESDDLLWGNWINLPTRNVKMMESKKYK